ncbi:MAG TPA: farnesyl diphosphate synthase [Candidatus Limnocylindrales bacterium]|nr:farnesyl diphosphate synthase [Candidatus Limnocylindrales bacterium]
MRDVGLAKRVIQNLPTFDLDAYLRSRRAVVDRALEGCLKRASVRSGNIWKAMRYGVFPGGKRIRPILVLAAGELFGAKRKALLPFACAVELIHCYSLIHDDLPALDNDDLRRGAPTNHRVFGEGMALLAGDGLLTEAFHVLSGPEIVNKLPAELVLKLIRELSHAVGVNGLVGGQAFDLEAERCEVDIGVVEYIHMRKTGALIRASIRIGAQVAGAKAADLRRVSRFGEALGLAFQIADDILDILGETAPGERAESGRSEWNKATYPSVVGVAKAQDRLRELQGHGLRELAPFGAAGEALRAITEQVVNRALKTNGKPRSKEMHG